MDILIGYGYSPTTTGRYIEECLADAHHVAFVGSSSARPGYRPNVDLPQLVKSLDVKPDLFLYIDSDDYAYVPLGLERLDCPTAAYMIDVHLGPRLRRPLAELFDFVFVAQRNYVPLYRAGPQQHAEWLPLACDPRVHRPLDLPRIYDVGFVGHATPHEPRTALLQSLEKRFKVNDYRRPYSREEMAAVYNQSRIVFNHSIRDDVNMRVFEAMACGALLITDRIGNGLPDIFIDGRDLVTYASEEELLEKVAYYLQHDDEREAIAREGQRKVLRDHTYGCRVARLLSVVFQESPGAKSPFRSAGEAAVIARYAELFSRFRLLDAGFDLLGESFSKRQARLTALAQFGAAVVRRAKYG